MSKDNESRDLIFKIHENIIRADEKLRALVDKQQIDSNQIRELIKDLIKKYDILEDRVTILEKEGVKVSVFWKIWQITGPIAITILLQVLFWLVSSR